MLHTIQHPEYRQLVVELLSIVSTILVRNPELYFHHLLDLEQLIREAATMYAFVSPRIDSKTIFFTFYL